MPGKKRMHLRGDGAGELVQKTLEGWLLIESDTTISGTEEEVVKVAARSEKKVQRGC